jgi:hypothetical protein
MKGRSITPAMLVSTHITSTTTSSSRFVHLNNNVSSTSMVADSEVYATPSQSSTPKSVNAPPIGS